MIQQIETIHIRHLTGLQVGGLIKPQALVLTLPAGGSRAESPVSPGSGDLLNSGGVQLRGVARPRSCPPSAGRRGPFPAPRGGRPPSVRGLRPSSSVLEAPALRLSHVSAPEGFCDEVALTGRARLSLPPCLETHRVDLIGKVSFCRGR